MEKQNTMGTLVLPTLNYQNITRLYNLLIKVYKFQKK